MSTTTKTVLIVSGVAVGAFVLAKALAPKPTTTNVSLFGSGGAGVLQGVFSQLGSAIAGLTKSGSSSSSSGNTPYYAHPLPNGFDATNYTVENNSFYTDASGNFVAG
ncbi:MAG TPA: hypothetical protein VFJ64_10755 [Solirubrobacterales bacterium]|nr:hypothetical protein [Solirubrobacterales bacterium]